METRFTRPLIESIALGRCSPEDLPREVIREVQMIVFWVKRAVGEVDASAFSIVREGGSQAFQLSDGYRLHFEIEEDLITFTDLLCK
jgi:hypothetical protein